MDAEVTAERSRLLDVLRQRGLLVLPVSIQFVAGIRLAFFEATPSKGGEIFGWSVSWAPFVPAWRLLPQDQRLTFAPGCRILVQMPENENVCAWIKLTPSGQRFELQMHALQFRRVNHPWAN